MGYLFGGLIIKNGAALQDMKILGILGAENYRETGGTDMMEATSRDFMGIAITRLEDMAIVIGRKIPFTCAMHNDELSAIDKHLATLSKDGDILCFFIDSTSETYSFLIYQKGERTRVRTDSENKTLYTVGKETKYDRKIEVTDDGLLELIEKFTGHAFTEIEYDLGLKARVFKKPDL